MLKIVKSFDYFDPYGGSQWYGDRFLVLMKVCVHVLVAL